MASCADTPCPHLSIPVEMDESMTSSSLNLAWPACQKCSSHVDVPARNNDIKVNDNGELECSGGCPRGCGLPSKVNGSVLPVATPTFGGVSALEVDALHLGRLPYPERLPLEDEQCESSGFSQYNYCNEERQFHLQSDIEENLESPCSLRSDVEGPRRLFPHRLHGLAHFPVEPRCPQHHHPHLNYHTPEHQKYIHARPSLHPIPGAAMVTPHHQVTAPMRDMMSEAFVLPSRPVVAPEMKRTVSLPEECRTVFITYSIDTAKDIFRFVAFLSNQGFRPAIDIFENAVRQMDVIKWMDSYLKNKSVLIIVVISPRYKQDIEGDGSDQHGLHTKYIHAQIQNEFIQQRCLNFRIVPVLFPNANQSHVPMWLQSTRVFRWPQDAKDLLLRLLREERYIPPPRGHEITLSIKSL